MCNFGVNAACEGTLALTGVHVIGMSIWLTITGVTSTASSAGKLQRLSQRQQWLRLLLFVETIRGSQAGDNQGRLTMRMSEGVFRMPSGISGRDVIAPMMGALVLSLWSDVTGQPAAKRVHIE